MGGLVFVVAAMLLAAPYQMPVGALGGIPKRSASTSSRTHQPPAGSPTGGPAPPTHRPGSPSLTPTPGSASATDADADSEAQSAHATSVVLRRDGPVRRQIGRKFDFDAEIAKSLGLATTPELGKLLNSKDSYLKAASRRLEPLEKLPRVLADSNTPSSYSYFMQMQPTVPGAGAGAEHNDARTSLHIVHFQAGGGGGGEGAGHGAAGLQRLLTEARDVPDTITERLKNRPRLSSGIAYDSLPFAPIEIPSTYSHGNPRLRAGRKKAHKEAGTSSRFRQTHDSANYDVLRKHKPNYKKGYVPVQYHGLIPTDPATAPGLRLGPAAGMTAALKRSRYNPNEPNLGLSAVPGDVGTPPTPVVREFDPYTGKFKVVATEDSHDSRESYRPPAPSGSSRTRLALSGSLSSSSQSEADDKDSAEEADEDGGSSRYEVHEDEGGQEHYDAEGPDDDGANNTNNQKQKFLNRILPTHPSFYGPSLALISNPPNKQGARPWVGGSARGGPHPWDHHRPIALVGSQSPAYETKHVLGNLHRPRAPPRKRKLKHKHHRMRNPLSHIILAPGDVRAGPGSQNTYAADTGERTRSGPYFEFKNPVNNIILEYNVNEGEDTIQGVRRGNFVIPSEVGEYSEGDADGDGPEGYITWKGDAEREALNNEQQQAKFPEDDENVFGSFEVFHTLVGPNKEFSPFVRFPFETERSNLKAMVGDLIKQ